MNVRGKLSRLNFANALNVKEKTDYHLKGLSYNFIWMAKIKRHIFGAILYYTT